MNNTKFDEVRINLCDNVKQFCKTERTSIAGVPINVDNIFDELIPAINESLKWRGFSKVGWIYKQLEVIEDSRFPLVHHPENLLNYIAGVYDELRGLHEFVKTRDKPTDPVWVQDREVEATAKIDEATRKFVDMFIPLRDIEGSACHE